MRTERMRLVLVGLAVAGAQAAAVAQPVSGQEVRARLTGAGFLMTDASPSTARPADCQPRKGEAVTVLDTRNKIDGIAGLSAVHVIVLEGSCKGVQGWIGPKGFE
nr:hypothetical protein [Variovorax boronicumulans]